MHEVGHETGHHVGTIRCAKRGRGGGMGWRGMGWNGMGMKEFLAIKRTLA